MTKFQIKMFFKFRAHSSPTYRPLTAQLNVKDNRKFSPTRRVFRISNTLFEDAHTRERFSSTA